MKTILSIIGTRPEAIKMAPVVRALAADPARFKPVLCVTGQHREMLDQVLALFQLRPDYDLNLMTHNQSLADLTAALFTGMDRVVREARPDWILAQGDTTTVMVAGLLAFYRRIKFGHVEAGLRTGNRLSPFPEEINRRIADLVADAYFAPTERARQTLLAEGCAESAVHVTGNTVIDALHYVAALPYDLTAGPLATIPLAGRLVLVTAHRRESFGEPFRHLCLAIRDLAERFPGTQFIYPVHLNPNVRHAVTEILGPVRSAEQGARSREQGGGRDPKAVDGGDAGTTSVPGVSVYDSRTTTHDSPSMSSASRIPDRASPHSPRDSTASFTPCSVLHAPGSAPPNLHLLPPLPYLDLVQLMKRCTLILTDSGGIQEEAPGLGVPALVMRDTTERPEGVAAGVVRLVGTDRHRIVEATAALLTDPAAHNTMATGCNPYGDGHASGRILAALAAGVSHGPL